MKSGTSFCNGTLMKKNLLRFWPIWAVYGLIWAYVLPLRCLMVQQEDWSGASTPKQNVLRFAQEIPEYLSDFGMPLALCFGLLAAMAMFSYLFNSRSAYMIHTLPMKRETLFFTNYLSGLVCLLAPNAVIWLATLVTEAPSGYVDLNTISIWLAAQSAMCLFFYSFAVFCAMFTGNMLALVAFYGIFNALASVVVSLLELMFGAFLYGYGGMVESVTDLVLWLTPTANLAINLDWTNSELSGYRLTGIPILVIYSIAALVLVGLSVLVYRRRHVESAGDVVAIPLVRPLFKYGVAFCSSLCFGFFVYEYVMGLSGNMGLVFSLLIWAAIGYFVAEMLLRKSFRVLNAWKGCVVLVAVVALASATLMLDLFGYNTRLPDPSRVVSVSAILPGSVPYDSGRRVELTECTDSRVISLVADVHREVVAQYQGDSSLGSPYVNSGHFYVDYTMDNGTVISREYYIAYSSDTPLAQALEALMCDPELVRDAYGLDEVQPDALSSAYVELWDSAAQCYKSLETSDLQQIQTLYQAVLADFEAGNLGRHYLFDEDPHRLENTYISDLVLQWEEPLTKTRAAQSTQTIIVTHEVRVTLTPQAANTLAAMEALGWLADHTLLLYGQENYPEKYPATSQVQ